MKRIPFYLFNLTVLPALVISIVINEFTSNKFAFFIFPTLITAFLLFLCGFRRRARVYIFRRKFIFLFLLVSYVLFIKIVSFTLGSYVFNPGYHQKFKYNMLIFLFISPPFFVFIFNKLNGKKITQLLIQNLFFPVWIVLISLSTYTYNSQNFTSFDTFYAKSLPYILVGEKTFDLNGFFPNIIKLPLSHDEILETQIVDEIFFTTNLSEDKINRYIHPYFIFDMEDRHLSVFPISVGLINLFEIYILKGFGFNLLNNPESIPASLKVFGYTYQLEPDFVEKANSALNASIANVLIYFFLRSIFSGIIPILFTVIYAFSTIHYSVNSQAIWQHGYIEILLILSLFLFQRKINSRKAFLLGTILSLAFFIRPNSILIFLVLGLFYLFENENYKSITLKNVLYLLGGIFLIFIPLGLINWITYHNILGGYGVSYSDAGSFGNDFRANPITNFFGLLFSINRGLLIFHPFLIPLIIYSIYIFLKEKKFGIYYLKFYLIILIYLLFYSKFKNWHGGWVYGPRLLSDINPIYILLGSYFFKIAYEKKHRLYISFFLIFSVLSFAIQYYGVRDSVPTLIWNTCNNLSAEDRVWDLENSVFLTHRRYNPMENKNHYHINLKYLCSNGKYIEDRSGSYLIFENFKKMRIYQELVNKFYFEENKKKFIDEFHLQSGDYCISMHYENLTKETSNLKFMLYSGGEKIIDEVFPNDGIVEYDFNLNKSQKIQINMESDFFTDFKLKGIDIYRNKCNEISEK